MTNKRFKQLKKIWQGLGGKPLPPTSGKKKQLEKIWSLMKDQTKPLSYFEQIIRMPNHALSVVEEFDLRLKIVKHAIAYGVKPTACVFDTTPKTVRKWLKRYQQERCSGLNELPRIPHTCPHKTPLEIIKEISDDIDPAVARLPPLMLDLLGTDYITKEEFLQRGYDVPCYP